MVVVGLCVNRGNVSLAGCIVRTLAYATGSVLRLALLQLCSEWAGISFWRGGSGAE
jgi:hypothetical protein